MSTGKPNPRRAELAALSLQVRPLVKAGQFDNVNDAIRALYSQETGQSEWRTFKEWRDLGRPVRKGERGFPVWATPRHHKAEGAGGDLAALAAMSGMEPQGKQWFPVAYIFHALQVETADEALARRAVIERAPFDEAQDRGQVML